MNFRSAGFRQSIPPPLFLGEGTGVGAICTAVLGQALSCARPRLSGPQQRHAERRTA
jgi:hypothetical protein